MTNRRKAADMARFHPRILLVGLIAALGLIATRDSARADEKAVEFRNGVVVAVSPPGVDVGVAILKQGGNAVDAAVATAFALAVTYPAAGNIGGGGFMLVHPPSGKGTPVVFDYRETAPAAATVDMYAGGAERYGHKIVGVPGTVRGLEVAHKRFGKLPWKDLVAPAIKLAEGGFTLDAGMAGSLNSVVAGASPFPELRRVFGKHGGDESWKAGDRLVQPDLAKTLRAIAEQGPDAFYTGPIADL